MTWVTKTARKCLSKGQESRRGQLQKCGAPDNLVGFVLVFAVALLTGAPGRAADLQEKIPLVEGLTIVTAIAETRGDYESIKTVAAVTDSEVQVAYAAELRNGRKVQAVRRVLRADMLAAREYRPEFMHEENRAYPGTTALGTSRDVLRELQAAGQAVFTGQTRTSGGVRRVKGTLTRAGIVKYPVLVNGARVELEAVHAKGDFERETGEFWFLNDPDNPLMLRFHFVEKKSEIIAKMEEASKGKLKIPLREYGLDVVRIAYPVGETVPSAIEKQLEDEGRAEVYGIYFDFDSATLKPESTPVLKEIAALMAKNASWKLDVEGHTDNIGTAARNLALSKERAEAVKHALVTEYGIAAARLTPAGFGASRPRESNDTLAGRARNRRVELVKR